MHRIHIGGAYHYHLTRVSFFLTPPLCYWVVLGLFFVVLLLGVLGLLEEEGELILDLFPSLKIQTGVSLQNFLTFKVGTWK